MFWLFIAAGFGLFSLAHTAPFPFLLDLLAPASALWSMPKSTDAPTVYLTFDDGPNPAATPALLDTLSREGAVATFFLIDRHLTEETAPIVRRIFDEGHAVGLHTHTRHLMVMTPSQVASTLIAAADRIEKLAGQRPCRAFRPHGGWRSGQMYAGLAEIDYALVGWGWGLWDFNWYRRPDAEALANRLAAKVSDGDIIVIHDGHHQDPRADREYAVEAVARLVPALRDRGFQFAKICG
jgi:chitooligosaccharide deacetylase